MYQDFYLKFTDEAQAVSVLYHTEGAVSADPENNIESVEGTQVQNFRNIDVLGVIYNNDAVNDAEGNLVTPATLKDGWHVNVRVMEGEDSAALEPFQVNPAPTTPARVWG